MAIMDVKFKVDEVLLTDFIKYLFPADKNEDHLKVSGSHPLGKLFIANISISGKPVASPTGENVLTLRLPRQDATQDLVNKFLYYSQGATCRLNAALKATFDMDFHDYYQRGSDLGYQKKDIIDAFIVSRRLCSVDPADALHKRIYRHEQKKREKYVNYLSRKASYIQESLDASGLNNIAK